MVNPYGICMWIFTYIIIYIYTYIYTYGLILRHVSIIMGVKGHNIDGHD